MHDVEQADLNLAREVGELVDGENAAVGAGQKSVVDGQLTRDVVTAAGRFDGIDVADHVGDGDIGCGEFLHVAVIAREPRDGGFIALFGDQVAAAAADGMVGVVANFAARNERELVVQQVGQHTDDPRFCLPAKTEQNEVVAGENGVNDLGNHRIFVADDSGEQFLPALKPADEVLAKLVFYAAFSDLLF